MRVLIACEFSGIVRDAFSRRGHDAWSCDLLPTESELTRKEGKHIQGDVLNILNDGWDLMIAHPPCTYLCRNNAKCIYNGKYIEFKKAVYFFNKLKNANINKVCIENPVPHKIAKQEMGDYSQLIQPWQFGHDYSKKTCLWLIGLPKLKRTKIVKVSYVVTKNGFKYTSGWYKTARNWRDRSRTFKGIAKAMAEQWG